MKILTRNILILSLVSFFTDIASEMLFPIMPLYLEDIGYGVLALGIMEGVAEALAGLCKVYFGTISDKIQNRKIFIQSGYILSNITKPIMGFASHFGLIFGLRWADRLGKGIRTAPRDAILSEESEPKNRGKVFGFHRGLDTLGATLGPCIALVFLYYFPYQYRKVFFLAIIPGIIAVIFTFFIREQKREAVSSESPTKKNIFKGFKDFWVQSTKSYKRLLWIFSFLAFLSSSEMFLIFRARELNIPDMSILLSYVAYNVVFTFSSFPVGYLADRYGYKKIVLLGILLLSFVYALFGNNSYLTHAHILIFGMYGIYAAIHETVSKAWISRFIPDQYRASGFGLLLSSRSVVSLFGSIVLAAMWQTLGPSVAFGIISLGALILATSIFSFRFSEK